MDKSMPFVTVDRKIDGVHASSVTANDRESAYLLTRALISSGHQRVLLGRGVECSSMAERGAGYQAACTEAGIGVDSTLLLRVNDNLLNAQPDPGEIAAMERQIVDAGRFTAFYALNDRVLNAGIRSMQDLGIDVESIQLALHNEVSKPMPPYSDHIPRVVPPLHRMGWLAARALLDTIADGGTATSQIVLNSEIRYENLQVDGG
jgi:DNA-binding LacI/PurR family transcriptional regulator